VGFSKPTGKVLFSCFFVLIGSNTYYTFVTQQIKLPARYYKHIILLLFTVSLLLNISLFAQSKLHFENFSSENGLSQNSVYTIAQTKDGFMWFGTQDGLNRFDGKEFKKYFTDNVTRGKLSANYIQSLLYDATNNWLWMTMKNGVSIYQPATDSFISIEQIMPAAIILNRLSIKKVFSNTKNKFWFISYDDGVIFIDIEKKVLKRYFENNGMNDKINAIELHNDKIVVASLNNIYVLNNSGQFDKINLPNRFSFLEIRCLKSYANKLWVGSLTDGCWYIENIFSAEIKLTKFATPINEIGCFMIDTKQNLWIGTRGAGIVIYNDFTKAKSQQVKIDYENTSLNSNFLLSLFVDKQGIVWCGVSGGGISKYDSLKYQFITISKEPLNNNSLADNMIFCMYENVNFIFYGSQNSGLIAYNKKTRQYKNFSVSNTNSIVDNSIYGITADDKGNIWLASWSGLMLFNTITQKITSFVQKENLRTLRLYTVHKMLHADSLFITGNFGSIFFSLTNRQWKPCRDITNWQSQKNVIGRHVYEDEQKNIWVATETDGLIKYEYAKGLFEPQTISNKTVSNSIRYIYPDKNILWLATDKGVAQYNTLTRQAAIAYGKKEGLGSNVCYAIQQDNKGLLWVSTNNGLFAIDKKLGTIKNYNKSAGLAFEEFNTACCRKDAADKLYFGGVGGIVSFNPLLLQVNTYDVPPIITGILINGNPPLTTVNISTLSFLALNHKENNIQFFFTVNNLSNSKKNQFAYRLVGTKEDWVYGNERNLASYTQLNPGKYIFELKAANSDGLWNKEITQMVIYIKPPFWQTWWFKLLLFTTITLSIYLIVKRRIKNIRHNASIDKQLADYEMKALHTQMNPHFIFNSLGTIKSMILNNQQEHASKYLSKFAKMIRLTLNHSTEAFISLQQNNEYITHYLEIENLRFNNAFDYEIIIDKDLDINEIKIPPMMIQPLVENAIWHGLLNKKGDKKLVISYTIKNNKLICSVDDNGAGLTNTKTINTTHKSVGINNIKQRLLLLNEKYKIDCSLIITDKATSSKTNETGTIATISLPYIT
jgi:ligand-binding sensor domain-containing protein